MDGWMDGWIIGNNLVQEFQVKKKSKNRVIPELSEWSSCSSLILPFWTTGIEWDFMEISLGDEAIDWGPPKPMPNILMGFQLEA